MPANTVLDRRALDRATLSRQMLPERGPRPPYEAIHALAGLHTPIARASCRIRVSRPSCRATARTGTVFVDGEWLAVWKIAGPEVPVGPVRIRTEAAE
jgi:hypothetical protein